MIRGRVRPSFRIPEHAHTQPRDGGALEALDGSGGGSGGSGGGGLSSITDGTTTVSPAVMVTVPGSALTDGGGGNAIIDLAQSRYGGLETLSTVATSGSTQTVNLANGNSFDITLTANCTFTFSGATSGKECSFLLRLRQDGTGSRLATWPGSVAWAGGTAPTLATAAGALNLLAFSTVDGGTNWLGITAGGSGTTSPLTTKGDVYTYSTVNARLGVGSDGYGLLADSTQTTGLRYGAFTGPLLIVDSPSTPLVFADIVQNDSQTDFVYADV